MAERKRRVSVLYRGRMKWDVTIEGPSLYETRKWLTIVLATYTTRDSAGIYARGIRRALRGLVF